MGKRVRNFNVIIHKCKHISVLIKTNRENPFQPLRFQTLLKKFRSSHAISTYN